MSRRAGRLPRASSVCGARRRVINPIITHSLSGFVDQESVPEFRVVAVGIKQRVGAIGLDAFGVGDRVREPAVVGLAGDLEDPFASP
ncbi:hypothetical protein ABH922_005702 [Rhodococcus sp. 27YEA15]|uniref:hypothetical protein n=1 Tax=Rhodococcus sp. 27YEA15 TaxID=3156259 RepID=UPI003C7DF756